MDTGPGDADNLARLLLESDSMTTRDSHKWVRHTADLALEVRGGTFPALVARAVWAVSDAAWGAHTLRIQDRTSFAIRAGDREMQLFLVLDEILFRMDARGELPVAARVRQDGIDGLVVELEVDRFDPLRHCHNIVLKAVTLHGLHVVDTADGVSARVVLDA